MIEARFRATVGRLPVAPGVYRFRDARGRALYIGRATDLRHRVGSYWSDLGDRAHLRRMVPQIERVEAVSCDSAHEAAWLERNLLETTKPRWNRIRGGMEVPVYIRLDERPRAPGLSVAHQVDPGSGISHFGPYLGGDRARLTLAALHRILPVAYTGTGLTGSERDMARVRGVTPADRAWIVDALDAVLAGNPDANARARAALDDLRNAAAAANAFERAAQIQAERDALEWITSPQRATIDGDADVDAYGWADGLLVHFAIRAGRLTGWALRPTPESLARTHVSRTPEAWTAFAQRNAELAAALAGTV